ncbi:regulator of (H+)-ATPase in vacuolar membrane [Sarracenia purpurea var. burkii]
MSESRDSGAGLDHKGGKSSGVQPGADEDEDEEEEEEKGKEVSRGGNEGSSTPKDTEEGATKPSGEENAVLPIKKQLQLQHSLSTTSHSQKETDDQLVSKSRDPSDKKANQEEAQAGGAITDDDDDDDDEEEESTEPPGILLFELQLTRSNRLLIPAKESSENFPPLGKDHRPTGAPGMLDLCDDECNDWCFAFLYYKEEDSFMIIDGWDDFANWHHLKSPDVIRFYKPPGDDEYHVQFERRNGEKPPEETPDFRTENFLFPLELTPSDIGYSRLFIPWKQVAIYFTDVRILPLSRVKETMKFTDERSKDWYMDIILYNSDYYMVIEGWVEFVKEHNLEAMNVIKFYKPVQPSHRKHFLIQCERKRCRD